MTKREQKAALLVGGLALIVAGHRIVDAEVGSLGLHHVVGGLLITAALKV
jgi:hypothetical protein